MSHDWSQLMSSFSQEQLVQMGRQIELATQAAQPWKPVPAKVAVQIELDDAPTISPEQLHGALKQIFGNAPPLTLEDLQAMQKATPRLHEWVEASQENAALLAVNPAAALRRVDLGLDKKLIDKLTQLLRNPGVLAPDPSVLIDSVRLTTRKASAKKKVGKEGSSHG